MSMKTRHTFTSVLREYSQVTTVENKEIKMLCEIMKGGFDPLTILKFEEQKRQQNQIEEMRKVQEKHLSRLLSREKVILAKQLLLNDIKLQAEKVRKEKREMYEKLKTLRQDQNQKMMKIIETCHAIEQATREALNSMINEKRRKVAEITEESLQLKVIMSKQKNEDAQRKTQLLQEIKRNRKKRLFPIKQFDPTESSGLGLLCEMSLSELKQELVSTKIKLNEKIKNRNTLIQQERERKKYLMRSNQYFLELRKTATSISNMFR